MFHKCLSLLFIFTLVACNSVKEIIKTDNSPIPITITQSPKEPTKDNKTIDACRSLHTLKAGKSAEDRDSRVYAAKGMTNNETDLIASSLYPNIMATGLHQIQPISSVKKDIERQCQHFAEGMEESQSWIGASAACLYPQCVDKATQKLAKKLKQQKQAIEQKHGTTQIHTSKEKPGQ